MVTKRKYKRIDKVDKKATDTTTVQATQPVPSVVPKNDKKTATPSPSAADTVSQQAVVVDVTAPSSESKSTEKPAEPSSDKQKKPAKKKYKLAKSSVKKTEEANPSAKPAVVTPDFASKPIVSEEKRQKEGDTTKKADVNAPSSSEQKSTPRPTVRDSKKVSKEKKSFPRWILILGSIVVVLSVLVGVFCWDRWYRYDDAAEFQGEWALDESSAIVVIDDEYLKITEDVYYEYTLDTTAKTISFTFGNLEGQGRYRFSLDRSQLVITDGSDYTATVTLIQDVIWTACELWDEVFSGGTEDSHNYETCTVLDRLSYDSSATPCVATQTEADEESEPSDLEADVDAETESESESEFNSAEASDAEQESEGEQESEDTQSEAITPSSAFEVSDIVA